jgi:tetratricopeptide (TPR) repeat protein
MDLSLAVLFSLPVSALADDVYLTDGTVHRDVQVLEETIREVKWRKDRTTGAKDAAEVLRIRHDRTVAEWEEANAALEAGDLEAAAQLFRAATENERAGRPDYAWLKSYGLFEAGEALRAAGKLEEAIKAYEELLRLHPTSRLAPEAFRRKALALRLKKDTEGAMRTLNEFLADVDAKALGDRWRNEANLDLLLIDPAVSAGERRTKLLSLLEATATSAPTVASRAKVEIGNAYVEEKRYKEARDYFDGIVKDPRADRQTVAGAFVGLGDCYFRNAGAFGDGANKAADYKKALLAYLRVLTVYRGVSEYTGKAILYAGRCFNLLGGPEDTERAKGLFARCMREFPGTPWAKDAENELRGR